MADRPDVGFAVRWPYADDARNMTFWHRPGCIQGFTVCGKRIDVDAERRPITELADATDRCLRCAWSDSLFEKKGATA